MAPPKAGLIVTTQQILPFPVIASFQKQFSLGDSVQAVTQAGQLSSLDTPPSSFSVVLSLSDVPGQHSEAFLAELSRVLQPGGTLQLQEPVGRRQPSQDESKKLGPLVSTLQTQADVERLLLLAGFSGKESISAIPEGGLAKQWTGITPASVGSIQGPLVQPFAVRAQKPQWSTGTSFALKKKVAKPAASASPTTAAQSAVTLSSDDVTMSTPATAVPSTSGQSNVWKMAMVDDDMDLVDEDALLTEDDMVRPPLPNNPIDECGPGKSSGRKACKNCTCGRAEMEESGPKTTVKAVLTSDLLDNPQSACGSCGLGDAFRCSGCPYKGLPAFRLGEKIFWIKLLEGLQLVPRSLYFSPADKPPKFVLDR